MFIADSCLINWYKQINYFASADIVFINIYHLYKGLGNLHDAYNVWWCMAVLLYSKL